MVNQAEWDHESGLSKTKKSTKLNKFDTGPKKKIYNLLSRAKSFDSGNAELKLLR